MKRSEPLRLFGIWKIYGHVSSRRDYIELWIKDINPMDNAVQTRQSKSSMTLILSNSIFAEKGGKLECMSVLEIKNSYYPYVITIHARLIHESHGLHVTLITINTITKH